MKPLLNLNRLILVLVALSPTVVLAQGDLTPLDDPIEKLQPIRERGEVDDDRLFAYAKFAEARLLFRRGDLHAALDRYERSFRYDTGSATALGEIVRLSFVLNRLGEAARYVLQQPNIDLDPLAFQRLAVDLTEQGDVESALKLYDRSLALRKNRLDSDLVLLHFELGRLRFLNEDYQQAADSFAIVQDALEHPDKYKLEAAMRKAMLRQPAVTWSLIAESMLEAGRVEESEELFARADKEKSRPALFAFHEARLAAKRDDHESAYAKLDEYFEAEASMAGTEPYELLGELMVVDNDNQQQQAAFTERLQTLRKNDPDNAVLAFFLASRLKSRGDATAAAEIYDEVLQQARSASALRDAAGVYLELNDNKRLLSTVGLLVESSGTLELLADVKEQLLADSKRIDQLLELGSVMKEEPGVALTLAKLATEAKKFDDAAQMFEFAAGRTKEREVETLMTWGLEFFMADQFKTAASVFQTAIDKTQDDAQKALQYYYLASCLALDDQFDQALEAATKAVELNPKDPRLGARAAWVHYAANDYDKAELAYREFLQQYADNYRTVEARESVRDARLMLSNVLVLKNELPEAEEALERVLDEFPQDVGAMNDLGYLWADQGKKLNRSLAMIQAAVDAEPDNEAYRDSLGWVYFRLQRYDEAVEQLRKAAEMDEPDPVILDHLGDALLKAGESEQAKQRWLQAVEGFKKASDADKQAATEDKIKKLAAEN